MVETIDNVFHHFAQVFEVEQESGLVQFQSRQSHTDLVVVPVRILALALVVPQVVPRGKCVLYGYLEHVSLSGALGHRRTAALSISLLFYSRARLGSRTLSRSS